MLPQTRYFATGYTRLSYDSNGMEEEPGPYKDSNSLDNQEKLIREFAQSHPEIELVSIRQDVRSGLLFDREDFQAMMEEIKAGKINCVIVKDLSRLGRDYINTMRYLRKVFPLYGVRFIAINDRIDTLYEHDSDDLLISNKVLMNDAYCQSISVGTRSALRIKRESGDYVGACPVYGYRKDPENKNHLVIDEDTAPIVRDIFRRRIEGANAGKIAEELNQLGVLSPLAYKVSRGLPHPTGGYADRPDCKWSHVTVSRILQNETYTGVLVQGKKENINYKLKQLVEKAPDKWARAKDAHQAIVSRRDYDLVQDLTRLDTRAAQDKSEVYLFSGLLICGCCGGRMSRKINTYKGKKYIYYHCPTGKKNGCDHPVRISEEALSQCVLSCLQAHIKSVVSLDELLDSISKERINHELVRKYEQQIADDEAQMEKALHFKRRLYESFLDGVISKKDYKDMEEHYGAQAEELREAIARLRQKIAQVLDNSSDRLKWIRHFEEFSTMTELDRRSVVTLVRSIKIISKTEVKITFRFQEEYEEMLQMLSSYKEAS